MPDGFALSFLWAPVLWALLLVLPLVWRHWRAARGGQSGQVWQTHGPFALVVLGLATMIAAMARPQAILLTPMREATVMLAIDTSGSMRADDVRPSRIAAARAAAERFLEAQPARLRVGLVTVAGTAALAQAPTDARDDLLRALENLPLQYGSALGAGVLIALDSLLPAAGIDVQKILNEGPAAPALQAPAAATGAQASDGRSMAIVLITDGQGNLGPSLLEMARLAAQHRVRVYTVGVGTPEGAIVQIQGRTMRARLEEETLQQVARLTQAEYFRAGSAEALHQVYAQLGHRFRFEKRAQTEVTSVVLALGMLLVLAGCLWSFDRRGRIV